MARYFSVNRVLTRGGPFEVPGFDASDPLLNFIQEDCKILVVGAGGLGCELLKNLALSGFRNIHVIDMDTIDVSNLNRQFLFRAKDVGSAKATVAADFVNARVSGAKVVAHFKRIEDYGPDFYRQFSIVVCGLDSILARRWINGMLHSLLVYDENGELKRESVIPLVDGGTEGFKGNSRVILPGLSACIDCTLDLYPPQVTFPMCTIANTPRLPEHCIEYVKIVAWPQEKPDVVLDGDDPAHIKWIFDKASARASQFGINGVTYRLTQGVIKNIIPAVASTNAVIAASCALEVLKLATNFCRVLNNYLVFSDGDGAYTYTFEYEKNADCLACSHRPVVVQCQPQQTLQSFIDQIIAAPHLQFKAPGLTMPLDGKTKTLYLQKPPAIEKATRKNLSITLRELGIESGQTINCVDPTNPGTLVLVVDYSN